MDVLLYGIVGILGLIYGSFLNVVIYRLEHGGSIVWDRSRCPHCSHTLEWQDLVPVISFLVLRGKCRFCSSPISMQYPLVEGTMALIAILIAQQVGIISLLSPVAIALFFALFLLFGILFAIFILDLKYFIIPDSLLIAGIIPTIAFLSLGRISSVFPHLASGLGASLFFWAIWKVSQGKWMGFGDVKLVFLLGLLLGWPLIAVSLFLSFFSGAVVGVSLMALGKKSLASEVPFAPFLIGSAFVSFFWGGHLLNWYLTLVLV
ncbi:MAG: prepilin peptidase [bacterium]|nr:prepilin peptidase [bacterium]